MIFCHLAEQLREQNWTAIFYAVSVHDPELFSGGLPAYRERIRERMPWSIQSHPWVQAVKETVQ